MSCGSEFLTSNCVCDTLLAIVEAQDQINPVEDVDCAFGCERAIQELVGGVTSPRDVDTIPVILFCKSTCAPFQAVGVRKENGQTPFDVVCGCVFRVVDVDPETCCATLEILGIVPESGPPVFDLCGGKKGSLSCIKHLEDAKRLARSGVCITVDLNCFCGVSCIFPVDLF